MSQATISSSFSYSSNNANNGTLEVCDFEFAFSQCERTIIHKSLSERLILNAK